MRISLEAVIVALATTSGFLACVVTAERARADRADARFDEVLEIATECLGINREIQELHQETSFDLPRGYEARLPSGMGGER